MSDDGLLAGEILYQGLQPFLLQAVPPTDFSHARPATLPHLRKVFSYATAPAPLAATVEARCSDQDLLVERVSYQTGPLTRATALVVKPEVRTERLPGMLLFHCHSGVYRWGSERLYETSTEPEGLRRLRQEKYAGRSLARDFARAGFLVVAPDTFYFGRRALGKEDVDAPANKIDELRRASESLVAKMFGLAGHSWPAVISWEDRRALDYLCSRPEVDPSRIGCLGLSLGGFQTVMLAAQDHRISAAVTVGWLTTAEDLLQGKVSKHSWMVLPWGLFPTLDIPTLAACACPAALLVLLCAQDHLFTYAGMQAAAKALMASYRSTGQEGRCGVEFFETPHSFTLPMQERALQWMKNILCDSERNL